MTQLFVCKRCDKSSTLKGSTFRRIPYFGKSRVCAACAEQMRVNVQRELERVIDGSIAKKQGRNNGKRSCKLLERPVGDSGQAQVGTGSGLGGGHISAPVQDRSEETPRVRRYVVPDTSGDWRSAWGDITRHRKG